VSLDHSRRLENLFYQLFEEHFDSYVRGYEERFEPRSGPLRPVVLRCVEEFLSCGRLQGGFARIRCPKCHAEHLLALSCRTRNFCSSCQAKRWVLFAEKLTSEILAPVAHRHWRFSIPRVLRGLIERDRELLGLLSQTAYVAVLRILQAALDRTDVRPGCVVSLQTYGGYGCNFNPHAHALVSDGVFSRAGDFLPLPAPDPAAVMDVFRLRDRWCCPRLARMAGPLHHAPCSGHECAAETRDSGLAARCRHVYPSKTVSWPPTRRLCRIFPDLSPISVFLTPISACPPG